jgi:hypothetical protein
MPFLGLYADCSASVSKVGLVKLYFVFRVAYIINIIIWRLSEMA